jgi:hypothetical protein
MFAGPSLAMVNALDDRGVIGPLNQVAVLERPGMLADRHVKDAIDADQPIRFPRVIAVVVAPRSISIHRIDETHLVGGRHPFDPEQREIAAIAFAYPGAIIGRAVKTAIVRPGTGPGIAVTIRIYKGFGQPADALDELTARIRRSERVHRIIYSPELIPACPGQLWPARALTRGDHVLAATRAKLEHFRQRSSTVWTEPGWLDRCSNRGGPFSPQQDIRGVRFLPAVCDIEERHAVLPRRIGRIVNDAGYSQSDEKQSTDREEHMKKWKGKVLRELVSEDRPKDTPTDQDDTAHNSDGGGPAPWLDALHIFGSLHPSDYGSKVHLEC